jgi:Tol biopolymer transport system component
MRRGTIVIALFTVLCCLFAQLAAAAPTRPIIYSKASWEWVGAEGERHIVIWGGLFATANGNRRQLTFDPKDREPNVSSDGSMIVFVRDGDLFSMRSDGSDLHQLTGGPELDEFPQISPDGQLVLFVRRSAREGPGDLYTVSLAGGEPRLLATSPEDDEEPAFAPDGKVIVFVRSLPKGGAPGTNDELYSIRPSGTGLTRLTRTPQDERRPHYFARGIVFDRGEPGRKTIYVMRRNGKNVRPLVRRRAGAEVKAVSPNGRLLVFEVFARGTWRKRLFGPTSRSLRSHRLTNETAGDLVFSPDGRRVAGAFINNSSEVAPFSVLSSLDVFSGRSRYEGESWEAEEPGPVQTSVGSRIAW